MNVDSWVIRHSDRSERIFSTINILWLLYDAFQFSFGTPVLIFYICTNTDCNYWVLIMSAASFYIGEHVLV